MSHMTTDQQFPIDKTNDAEAVDDQPENRRSARFRKPLCIAAGGMTAIGVATAAAFTAAADTTHEVGVAAWVTAAVVGTAAIIAAARHS